MVKPVFLAASLFLIPAATLFAQERGRVQVVKDPAIDSLSARRIRLLNTGRTVTLSGFRVQIFSGAERKNAYDEQVRFKALYPEMSSYISYTEPNYKVRVGDFRTRLEAEKFISMLRRQFQSPFVFAERINSR